MNHLSRTLLALVLSLGLIAAACGSSGNSTTSGNASSDSTASAQTSTDETSSSDAESDNTEGADAVGNSGIQALDRCAAACSKAQEGDGKGCGKSEALHGGPLVAYWF